MTDQRERQGRFDSVLMGPGLTLAGRIAAALNEAGINEDTNGWGTFYVSRVEISYSDGEVRELNAYLAPDEAEGKTMELHIPSYYEDFLEAKYNYPAWQAEKKAREGFTSQEVED